MRRLSTVKVCCIIPSLAASAGLALPRSREGKSRPARDATHTSGLFEFNSEILRMNHRSAGKIAQRFDHPPPVGWSGRTRGSKSNLDARNRNVCLVDPFVEKKEF